MKAFLKSCPVTLGLILVNVVFFGITYLKGGASDRQYLQHLLDTGASDPQYFQYLLDTGALFNPFTLGGQWYRILTSMFLHGFLLHLLLNMYGLFSVGSALESRVGSTKFALVYFLTGVASSYSSLYFSLFSISVGASGAIFGLFGFSLVINIIDTLESGKSLIRIVLNFIVFIVIYLFAAQSFNVDHAGHFGGLAFGAMLALADYFIYKEYNHLSAALASGLLLLTTYLVLPRDQVRYYNFFKGVINAEDKSRELFARKGISNNDFLISLKRNKQIWDSARMSLDSLPSVREELHEDTFKLRRYISLRSRTNEYRIRILNEEKYILMDSIDQVEDSIKLFLQVDYVLPVRKNVDEVIPENKEEAEPPQEMVRQWYDSNWVESAYRSVYYRMGFRDSLNQWDGPVRDFYNDGAVQMKGVYQKDQRDGIFLYYSHHNTYTSAGRYFENRRVGKWQTFHSNGQLHSEIFYNQGYFLNSVLDSLGTPQVVNGNGQVSEYYSSGAKKESGLIYNGRRNGTWTGWFESGEIHFREEYEDGHLVSGRSRNMQGDTFIYDQNTFYPVPVTGFNQLKEYLNSEAQKLDRPQVGTVEVSFRVTFDARLTDFEFEKNVGKDVRELVKGFLLNGPAWHPAKDYGYKNVDGYGEVKIEF